MKRRILALLSVLALVALVVPAAVFAANTGTVSCTVSAQGLVSVTVTPGSVAYGTVALNTYKNTAQYDATNNPSGMATPQTQTITNTGNVNEDFDIKTSNAVGATNWSLTPSTPTHDEFSHFYFVSTTAYNGTGTPMFIAFTWPDTNVEVATNVVPEGVRYLELLITMPGSTADTGNHTITVTVLATQH